MRKKVVLVTDGGLSCEFDDPPDFSSKIRLSRQERTPRNEMIVYEVEMTLGDFQQLAAELNKVSV